jgi:hypothetical protein
MKPSQLLEAASKQLAAKAAKERPNNSEKLLRLARSLELIAMLLEEPGKAA